MNNWVFIEAHSHKFYWFIEPLFKIFFIVSVSFLTNHAQAQIPYGDNKTVGKYIMLNGVRHYYEVYGEGPPVLMIHGNSVGIKTCAPQIDYFSEKYKVYAVDCRGRGRSELGKDSLTYLQMASDLASFIRSLGLDSVCIIGRSDGGIVGIMMGIYYPEHIRKIVAFGANMWPDTTALYPEAVNDIHDKRVKAESMIKAKDTTQNWYLSMQRYRMMEFQPHITAWDLHKIKAPVLVISCDRDVIKEEHTLFIYKNIPLANLCILPGETHHVPGLNPELFNSTVERFISQPFKDNSERFK
jgi:pimeloyl-ACP methyl ester carboxylesterase